MKIICAPDKFKGSLTAEQAAGAMARGVRSVLPGASVDLCPVADGGEGTVAAMIAATRGRWASSEVLGPRGGRVVAPWGILPGDPGGGCVQACAVMEMAAASGLALLEPALRDPTLTSTFGTGQLMAAALDHGLPRILLGIGGSATCDGGCGAAQALGVRFYDHAGTLFTEPIHGGMLHRIARIDMTHLEARLGRTAIEVACDVTNPLTGLDGAAHVYAPQKGASPSQVEQLDAGLRHLAELLRREVGCDVEHVPGAGAAGGLGAGLMAFLKARLSRGIDLVLGAVGFDSRVTGAALCLTGEGRIDGQTASGKTILGVAQAAAKQGVPTVALVGSAGAGAEATLRAGLTAYRVIGEGLSVDESMRRAEELLVAATADAVRSRGCAERL